MFQVDIFSLGGLLYSMMTLRKLPLEGSFMDFGVNIGAGRRPEFLQEVNISKCQCNIFICETVL